MKCTHWTALVAGFIVPTIAAAQIAGANRNEPPLCVIDDSKDIVGLDGFSTSNGRFPFLPYLFSALGCKSCCYWSAYGENGANCAIGPGHEACNVGEVRVPPLTMTSPLISVIKQALDRPVGRGVFFITNGLNWPMEGGDSRFRLEMDVGGPIAHWLSADPMRDTVFGMLQDNLDVKRRTNLVLGLSAGTGGLQAACESEVDNLPSAFSIHLARYSNPLRTLLRERTLVVRPSVNLAVGEGPSAWSKSVTISSDGIIEVFGSVVQRLSKGQSTMEFTFYLSGKQKLKPCWDIAVKGASVAMPMKCTGSDGRIDCRLPIDWNSDWLRRGGALQFQLIPSVPIWLEQTPVGHALRKTFSSFRREATVVPELRVLRSDAQPVGRLSIRIVSDR